MEKMKLLQLSINYDLNIVTFNGRLMFDLHVETVVSNSQLNSITPTDQKL
jgi:hypothetical protein